MRRCWLAVVMLALASMPLRSNADSLGLEVTTLVSSSPNIIPWGFEGAETGVSPRFIEFLLKDSGLNVKFDVRPLVRVVAGLKDGSNAITAMIPSDERDQWGIRICQPTHIGTSVAYLKGHGPYVQLSNLTGKSIGMLRGTPTFDKLMKSVSFHRIMINDMQHGMMMLAADRLDATSCYHPGCGHAMQLAGIDPASLDFLFVGNMPWVVYVSRHSTLALDRDLLAKLKARCESDAGQKAIQALVAQYE